MRTACEADSPLFTHLDPIPQPGQITDGAAFSSELNDEICLFKNTIITVSKHSESRSTRSKSKGRTQIPEDKLFFLIQGLRPALFS